MSLITVSVGETDLVFDADHEDLNELINTQTQIDKVGPTYNFLARTVVPESKDDLKRLLLTADNKPKGVLVMQIGGIVSGELGAEVKIALKKPKA